jgi:SAM-dependent methyltransferase
MAEQAQWWQSFFSDLYVKIQTRRDGLVRGQAPAEADFITQLLRVRPPARLLDVPCGTGRHAIELASRGYEVSAVDLTLPALEAAVAQAEQRQVTVDWHNRDMRDLPWLQEKDGAYCFFGSFGYFDDEGNLGFLQAVHRALLPGARFLVETHIAETILPRFQPQAWTRIGEALLLEERRYDHVRGRIETDWTLVHEGRSVQRSSSIRLYTYSELCRAMEQAGFKDFEAYDTATGQPFKFLSTRLSLVGTRA